MRVHKPKTKAYSVIFLSIPSQNPSKKSTFSVCLYSVALNVARLFLLLLLHRHHHHHLHHQQQQQKQEQLRTPIKEREEDGFSASSSLSLSSSSKRQATPYRAVEPPNACI